MRTEKETGPCDKLILFLEENAFKTDIIFRVIVSLPVLLEKLILHSKERSLKMRRRYCILQTYQAEFFL